MADLKHVKFVVLQAEVRRDVKGTTLRKLVGTTEAHFMIDIDKQFVDEIGDEFAKTGCISHIDGVKICFSPRGASKLFTTGTLDFVKSPRPRMIYS